MTGNEGAATMSEPVDLVGIEARRLLAMSASAGMSPNRRPAQEAFYEVLSIDVPALAREVEILRGKVEAARAAAEDKAAMKGERHAG